jgi:alpha-amylase
VGTAQALDEMRQGRAPQTINCKYATAKSAKIMPEETREVNGIILQAFHWFMPFDITSSLWYILQQHTQRLSNAGFTAVWIPPAQKSSGGTSDNGYMPYDFYDLGEFNQKGSIRTKWGAKYELESLIQKMHDVGIQVYSDLVMNHMDGGDEREEVEVEEFDEFDRNKVIGRERVYAWTKFSYWGRGGKHANFWIDKNWFDWLGYVETLNGNSRMGLFRLAWKPGNDMVSHFDQGSGTYDYLTGLDLDVQVDYVAQRLEWIGEWMLQHVGVDGFRLDAAKHINHNFLKNWCRKLREWTGRPVFCVAENVCGNVEDLSNFLHNVDYSMSAFDFPLHFNLVSASNPKYERRQSLYDLIRRFDYGFYHHTQTSMHGDGAWEFEYDLRSILTGTLVEKHPDLAVTFVDTHDSQPLRNPHGVLGDADWVQAWFRPHAYALILFRQGGYPCVFYPDVFGCEYWERWKGSWHDYHVHLEPVPHMEWMTQIRKRNAFGKQHDYFMFDDGDSVPPRPNPSRNIVGWTREGVEEFPSSGLAVILCNTRRRGESTPSVPVLVDGSYPFVHARHSKWMFVGQRHANKRWRHFVDVSRVVFINQDGWGEFCVGDGEMGCWIPDVSVYS